MEWTPKTGQSNKVVLTCKNGKEKDKKMGDIRKKYDAALKARIAL